MERAFLLLAVVVAGGLCHENNTSWGRGASLAVCQPDSCALISELSALRERMDSVVRVQDDLLDTVRTLVKEAAASQAQQGVSSRETLELRKLNQEQGQELKTMRASMPSAAPRVAFSAALGDSVGPFDHDTTLKYQRILSNMGSGYNPATGSFTATVRGVYYFSYTMYNNNSGQPSSVVSMMMNSQRMVSTWDTEGDDSHDSATNAAVVQLEAGDSVYILLYANRMLYDDGYYYNTFSGFLLFPM
ncbi:complement C1q-like protein 2 [Gadus morhua]|uniref:complement C1q-like protein 2 n=1 Tax=Gadus morhua TaxID=8049 RepID=UPI0011B565F8|nr:complement C1q-like protein 2 [Gadus morhua]